MRKKDIKSISNRLIDIIDTSNEPNILQKMEWGGTRQGSGAKPKYNKETKTGNGEPNTNNYEKVR